MRVPGPDGGGSDPKGQRCTRPEYTYYSRSEVYFFVFPPSTQLVSRGKGYLRVRIASRESVLAQDPRTDKESGLY